MHMIEEESMVNDPGLLREFIASGSETAFNSLVERYHQMVYRTCLRSLSGNAAEADDATQAVFIILAQKANKIKNHESLAPWLFRTSRWVVKHIKRNEGRRRKHHRQAAIEKEGELKMEMTDRTMADREFLDEAIASLETKQQNAIVCHYLRGMSVKDAARVLGCNENTMKKRISSGLEKLRGFLARKGTVLPAAALLLLLENEMALAAPAYLAQTATTAALASLGTTGWVSTGSGLIAKGAMEMMIWAKTKLIAGVAVSAIAVSGIVTPFILESTAGETGQEKTVAITPKPDDGDKKKASPQKKLDIKAKEAARLEVDKLLFDPVKFLDNLADNDSVGKIRNEWLKRSGIIPKDIRKDIPILLLSYFTTYENNSWKEHDGRGRGERYISFSSLARSKNCWTAIEEDARKLKVLTNSTPASKTKDNDNETKIVEVDGKPMLQKTALNLVNRFFELMTARSSTTRNHVPDGMTDLLINGQTLVDSEYPATIGSIILTWQFEGEAKEAFSNMKLHAWKWEDCSAEIVPEINQDSYYLISEEAKRPGSWIIFSYAPNDLRHKMGETENGYGIIENVYGIMFVVQKLNKAGKYQPLIRSAIPCKVKAKWLEKAAGK